MKISKPQIFTFSTSIKRRLENFKRQYPNAFSAVLFFEDEEWPVNCVIILDASYVYEFNRQRVSNKYTFEIFFNIAEFTNSKLEGWIRQNMIAITGYGLARDIKKDITIVNLSDINSIRILHNAYLISVSSEFFDESIHTSSITCELFADYVETIFNDNT